MRDVLREEKVLTKKDRETIPTIKEIEKTLESYPAKADLRQALRAALAPYVTKTDLASAASSILSEIKKMREELGLKKITFPSGN